MRVAFAAALLTCAVNVSPALAASAPAWTVNKAASRLAFTASMNGQPINGTFRSYDTRIAFDPANLAGSSVIAQIDTGSAATGDAARDQSLPTADWLNARVFPRATFRSTRFKALGGNRYVADGVLSIRGVNRPVALPFQLAITGRQAKMRGSLVLDRRWFGIGQGQFAGTEAVAAQVRVTITIAAQR